MSPSVPVYRGELQIQPMVLTNRPLVTGEYFSYVIYTDTQPLSNVTGVPFLLAGFYQMSAWVSLGEYFNSAYWEQRATSWPWAKRLWAIRDAIGPKKADRIIAYTSRLIMDNPAGDSYIDNKRDPIKGFDVYFSRKLKAAYSIVVSQSAGWEVIANILEKDGISVK